MEETKLIEQLASYTCKTYEYESSPPDKLSYDPDREDLLAAMEEDLLAAMEAAAKSIGASSGPSPVKKSGGQAGSAPKQSARPVKPNASPTSAKKSQASTSESDASANIDVKKTKKPRRRNTSFNQWI
jgi:hypothetical protein